MKTVNLAITLTVGIILVGAILVPVIQDSTDGDKVTYQNGTYYMKQLAGDHTIIVSSSGVLLDGETLDADGGCWYYADEINVYRAFGTYHIATPTGVIDISTTPYTIAKTGNTAIVTDGDTSQTIDCTNSYVPTSDKTAYSYVKYNVEMHLNSLDDVILSNMYTDSSFYAVVSGVASVNGVETGAIVSDNLVEVEGIDDVYTTSKIIVEKSGVSTTIGAGTIVPAEISGIVTGSDEGPEIGILLTIPVMVILSLLIVAVRATLKRE